MSQLGQEPEGRTREDWPQAALPREQPTSAAAKPRSDLYQLLASNAQNGAEEAAELLQLAPRSTTRLVVAMLLLLASALALAAVLEIEVVAEARGVLSSSEQPRAISVAVAGLVARVRVASGEQVAAGDVLVELDSRALRAEQLEAEHRRDAAATLLAWLRGPLGELYGKQLESLEQRKSLLLARVGQESRGLKVAERRVHRAAALKSAGVGSEAERDDADSVLYQLRASSITVRSQVAELDAQRIELERARAAQLEQAEAERAGADARLRSLAVLLEQTSIRAPHAGVLESLYVHVGELVQPATIVARVVPRGAVSRAVMLVEQRDRPFLVPGASARLEVDGMPSGEFGWLRGKVERVAFYPASPFELAELLGSAPADGAPRYRVDLVLEQNAELRLVSGKLLSGTGARGSLVLRRRPGWALLANALARD